MTDPYEQNKIRATILDDRDVIQSLSRQYHISNVVDLKNGCTGAVYSKNVLENIIKEMISATIINEASDISGYFLVCSPIGFKRAFGYSLESCLSEYGVPMDSRTFYAAQVCLDRSIQGQGYWKELVEYCSEKAKDCGAKSFVAEILEQNKRCQASCEKTGWKYISKRKEKLGEFKGSIIQSPIMVTWLLYELKL